MAKSRRRAREAALRALYQIDVGQQSVRDAIFDMRETVEIEGELLDYAESMCRGIGENLQQIDALISECLIDWQLDRIAVVDRNLMRIAAYEMIYVETMPPAVSINEAIELAKKYSTAESGKFVNGVLGRLISETPKANWDPSMGEPPEEPAEPEPVIEEEVTPEQAEEVKAGFWKVRS